MPLQVHRRGKANARPLARARRSPGVFCQLLPRPVAFGLARIWLLVGRMTLSKVCVSASPEKKAIANSGTVPVLRRSCRTSFGSTKVLPGPTGEEPPSTNFDIVRECKDACDRILGGATTQCQVELRGRPRRVSVQNSTRSTATVWPRYWPCMGTSSSSPKTGPRPSSCFVSTGPM